MQAQGQAARAGTARGLRAAAITLFNSAEAYVTTQGSFHLRGPLMFAFTESAMVFIDSRLRAHGHELKPGSHEAIWTKAVLTLIAHRAAGPLVGAVNGGLGTVTALARWSVNAVIAMAQRLAHCMKHGGDLPEPEAFLQLPVNRDMRMLGDDVATYAFDTMVFTRTLQVGLDPSSVPASMRPASMRGRSGVEPSLAAQSSGLAIFTSVLTTHADVWRRDGKLDLKAPPTFMQIVSAAPGRVLARMRACDEAMHARLKVFGLDTRLNAPLLIGSAALAGGYLKPYPLVGAFVNAGLTTAAFHAFGPAWGDGKFVREMPRPAIEGARGATPDDGYEARYATYLAQQHDLTLSAHRASGGEHGRSAVLVLLCDTMDGLVVSGMLMLYVTRAGSTTLSMDAQQLDDFLGTGTDTDPMSLMDNPLAASLMGAGTGVVCRVVSSLMTGDPAPAPDDVAEELTSQGDHVRTGSRDQAQLGQLTLISLNDGLIALLHAGGVLSAPGALCAALGVGLIHSVDVDSLHLREKASAAVGRLSSALRGLAERCMPGSSGSAPPRTKDSKAETELTRQDFDDDKAPEEPADGGEHVTEPDAEPDHVVFVPPKQDRT